MAMLGGRFIQMDAEFRRGDAAAHGLFDFEPRARIEAVQRVEALRMEPQRRAERRRSCRH